MEPSPDIATTFALKGRVAVITGAASGLGQETARVFSLAGATLVLADVNAAGLEATADMVREAGGTATPRIVNIANRDEVEALADDVVREHGRLDRWINCAGLSLIAPILSTAQAEAEKIIDVNMMGTYWGCAAAGRVMKNLGGGAIVNISSGGGDLPVPSLSVYGMTKAAVNLLTKTCAKEFGPFGIRVNAVAPGWIETPMGSNLYRDASGQVVPEVRDRVRREQAATSPLGINGEPSDIAFAILYLATDASRFVTGQVLHVNGGRSM
jgi:3-oxoacyl-[acyl-carrier protein] reductase